MQISKLGNTQTPPALRVAGVPEHFNLPWRELSANSARNSNGTITYREYRGGTGAMAKALADNDVDIAVMLSEGALLDIARGGRHRIVKVYVDTPLEWGIHVAANSTINSIADVQGRRYAISRPGSGSHIMAAVHAADQGWPVDGLRYVQINNLDGARRALPAGRADVFFWEKTMTQPHVDSGEFRCLGSFTSPWPSFVVCATVETIKNRSAALLRVLTRINRHAGHLQLDCDSALLIANTYQLRLPAAERWLNHTRWNLDFELPDDTLAGVLEVLKSLHLGVNQEVQLASMLHPFRGGVAGTATARTTQPAGS